MEEERSIKLVGMNFEGPEWAPMQVQKVERMFRGRRCPYVYRGSRKEGRRNGGSWLAQVSRWLETFQLSLESESTIAGEASIY